MSNQSAKVNEFMQTLDHPLKAEVEKVRAIILHADNEIGEQIKWNAPSFGYHGEDRVTFKLHPPTQIQLIFHRGAKAREDSTLFVFEDHSGLLKWVAPDRAVVTLHNKEDVEAKEAALTMLVREWLQATKQ